MQTRKVLPTPTAEEGTTLRLRVLNLLREKQMQSFLQQTIESLEEHTSSSTSDVSTCDPQTISMNEVYIHLVVSRMHES